ncbi:mRNA decay activator protein ZFP36 [Bienertia sinuspersici]
MDANDLALQVARPPLAPGFFPQSGTGYQTSMNSISATRNYPVINPKLKTGICKSFSSTGTCRFGDKCVFAHGTQELRKSRMMNLNTSNRQICRFSREKCPYGDKCIFPHERSDTYERKGDMAWKKYGCDIQPGGGVDSRGSFNYSTMLNTCNYGSKQNDAHGQAELRSSACNLASESEHAQIAPTALAKDAITKHKQTPTASVYKLRPEACSFKWKRNNKIAGIYADWIIEESISPCLADDD